MKNKKRLMVFSELERSAIYDLPNFNETERKVFFKFTELEEKLVSKEKNIITKMHYALYIGYFKAKKRLFRINKNNVNQEDVAYLKKYYLKDVRVVFVEISKYLHYQIKQELLKFYGYKNWSNTDKKKIEKEIQLNIKLDIGANFIGREIIKYCSRIKLIAPKYTILQDLITDELTRERLRISKIIDKELNEVSKEKLNSLMKNEETFTILSALKKDAKNFSYKMMIKERHKYRVLKELYTTSVNILKSLNISQKNIEDYGALVLYYNVRNLRKLKENQNYLYVLCYIFRKYREISDNLAEGFKYNSQNIEKKLRESVKKQFQEETSKTEKKVGKLLLLYVNKKLKDAEEIGKIREKAFKILEKEKIEKLGKKYTKRGEEKKKLFWQELSSMKNVVKKNIRPLFMSLKFKSDESNSGWIKSAEWLIDKIEKRSLICLDLPVEMPRNLKKYLIKDEGVDVERYEYWFYQRLQDKLQSGVVYIEDSIVNDSFIGSLIPLKKGEKVLAEKCIKFFENPKEEVVKLTSRLDELWEKINTEYSAKRLSHLRYDEKKKKFIWSRIKADKHEKLRDKFYNQLPYFEIKDILKFVDDKLKYLSALSPLKSRYSKAKTIANDRKIASIISRAFNYGDYKMSQSSNISYQELKTTASQVLSLGKLEEANNIISKAIKKLEIYEYYSIDLELLFSSVDGQKYELESENIKARHSKKYFGEKAGVSVYTILANNIPYNCYIIGANEHESYNVFDIWYNNDSEIEPDVITGDMHSQNKVNFAILYAFGVRYQPRFKNLNKELKKLYSGKKLTNKKSYELKPIGEINKKTIIRHSKEIRQIIGTLASKNMKQANLIKKLCHLPKESNFRKGMFELDKLIRSIYTLEYMINRDLQKSVSKSQNRIESYHQLRGYLAKIGGRKKLYGKTDLDVEISNQCGRLVANIVIYYNSYILSELVLRQSEEVLNRESFKNKLKKLSPIAWQHIHFLGQYNFKSEEGVINIDDILKKIKI